MATTPFRSSLSHSSLPSVSFSSLRTSTPLHIQLSTPSSRRHESTRRRLVKRLTLPGAPTLKTHKVLNVNAQQIPSSSHIVFNPPPAPPNVFQTPLKFLPEGDARRKFYEDRNVPSMYNLPSSSQNHETGKDDIADIFKGGNVFKEAARALGYGRDSGTTSRIKTSEPFTVSPVTVPGTALHSIPHTYPAGLAPRLSDTNVLPPLAHKLRPEPRVLTQSEVNEIRKLRREAPEKWTISKLCKKYDCNFGIIRAIWASNEAAERHEKELEKIKEKWGRRRTVARMERARRKALWEMDA